MRKSEKIKSNVQKQEKISERGQVIGNANERVQISTADPKEKQPGLVL